MSVAIVGDRGTSKAGGKGNRGENGRETEDDKESAVDSLRNPGSRECLRETGGEVAGLEIVSPSEGVEECPSSSETTCGFSKVAVGRGLGDF